jgi:hypothetical protein
VEEMEREGRRKEAGDGQGDLWHGRHETTERMANRISGIFRCVIIFFVHTLLLTCPY